MLKLAVAVLAVALAGTVAAGWRDLEIDGSSEAAFQQSLAAFREELSRERQQVFQRALMDIWLKGTADAKAAEREYTVSDYHSQLDGLTYDEVVTFTDSTGETAKQRYEEAKRMQVSSPTQPPILTQPSARARADAAHQALDHADAMGGRQGGTFTPHGGSAVEGVAPSHPP